MWIETVEILKADSKSSKSLGELKGIAETMPNQAMLVNPKNSSYFVMRIKMNYIKQFPLIKDLKISQLKKL